MSLFGVLGVVFIVLKLVGVIAWSWWLVLLPFYFGLAVWFALVGFAIVLTLIGSILGRK